MGFIDNKMDDIAVSDVVSDKGLHVVLRHSYVPLGGMVAVKDCSCGKKSKEKIFYQRVHHFSVENQELSCDCGNKIMFSYGKIV